MRLQVSSIYVFLITVFRTYSPINKSFIISRYQIECYLTKTVANTLKAHMYLRSTFKNIKTLATIFKTMYKQFQKNEVAK